MGYLNYINNGIKMIIIFENLGSLKNLTMVWAVSYLVLIF